VFMFSANIADKEPSDDAPTDNLSGFIPVGLSMVASNLLAALLSVLPVGQTPAAVLSPPEDEISVSAQTVPPSMRPGTLVQAQPEPPEVLPAPEAPEAFSPAMTPVQDWARRLFGGAEYLHWWLREARLPPLLTTSSPAAGGLLGVADTSVVFGGDRSAGNTAFNGTRLTLGYWFAIGKFGFEAEAIFLPSVHSTFTAGSNGGTLLALPFTNAVTGLPTSTVIAGPTAGGIASGSFEGYTATSLYGQEINFVCLLAGDGEAARLDYVGGLRFLQMNDVFDQTAISQTAAGLTLAAHDEFTARSTFYGFSYGLRGTLNRGPFSLQLRGLGAMGGTDQQVATSGSNFGASPGFLVQPSNRGNFQRTRFDMVYEVGINVGWRPTSWLKLYAGYTFLWWVNPIRAGDQVDTTLNLTGAGPIRPAIPFKQDSLTAHGLNAGLAFRW
jgi:hypothetical protein